MKRGSTFIVYSVVGLTYVWLWYTIAVLRNPVLSVLGFHPVFCLGGGLLIRKLATGFENKSKPPGFMLAFFGTVGIAVLITFIITTLAAFLLQPSLVDPEFLTQGLFTLRMDKAHFWLVGGWVAIVNPFAEEFFWRTSVFGFFLGRMSHVGALIVMSILFAGYHPLVMMIMVPTSWLVLVFVMTFMGGLIFGEIYYRTKNIAWTIILHLVININLMLIGWQYAPG